MTTGELGNQRIVDCSSGLAGAYCSKMFADAGADVLRIEEADGDPLRRWSVAGPRPVGHDGALFGYLRQGQRSVVARDARHLETVIAGADLVVVDRYGVGGDPVALRERHSALVVVAISPFGLTGPLADRAATELTIQAESGALAIRGRVERPPLQAGGQVSEWVTGAYAAVGGLAALTAARRTGHGELVDVSWCEVANLTCTLFSDLFDSVAGGIDLATAAPARSFESPSVEPTLDGYVGFNTNTRQQFSDFLVMIERPELLAEFAPLTERMRRWEEWNEIVHEWTTRHTTAEIVELAALLRIPVTTVNDARALIGLDHPVQRCVFVPSADHSFQMPRRPWQIDGEPHAAPGAVPAIGEHTATIDAEPPPPRRAVRGERALPFAGLKVIDMTGWWAGPSMTGIFAMLGADVIHVESCTHPDGIRLAGGAFFTRPRWWELSAFFLAANTNKRGLTLDFAKPEGRDLLLQLVADADLVVENFTPRVLEGFDLGWDVIHAANPRAVMVRMPAFGLDGPWRDRPGFAQTMEQVTGLSWVTGYADDQPRIQRGPCDPNGGMHAAFAAMVGLQRRERTGVGCFVETPMFEAAVAVAAEPILEWTAYANLLERDGNHSARAAPQGVFACAGTEQWLAVSVLDDAQWSSLLGLLGDETIAADQRFATHASRREHRQQLHAIVAAWASTQDRDDVVRRLIAAGVPAAAPCDPRRTREHPQFKARRFHELVAHPVAGTLATVVLPFRFASIERWITSPAPTMGQHNAELLGPLGVTADDLATLTASGVIGVAPVGY
ncbi:MAG TPA: CoA transferase [Ilumatobacteraceae bacterium]